MRASGAESLNVAASIFMGQTEGAADDPAVPPEMTESELMTVMTSGMAHISGGIMAAYILFGIKAEHLLTAVIMTAPGTIMMAKIFVPETQVPETMGTVRLEVERTDVNVIDAAGRGTGEGLHLALNVGAMLISFLALIALVNAAARSRASEPAADLRLGVRADRVEHGRAVEGRATVGNLLGTRMALNEFVAYSQLGPLQASLDPKSFTICTVRAVRLRQLQFDRHPDRRHRRAGADTASRSRAARPARDVCRHARQLHDGDDCGVPAVDAMTYFDQVDQAVRAVHARAGAAAPTSPSSSGPGSATSPAASPARRRSRTRAAALAGVERHRARRPPGGRDARRPPRRRAVGPRHLYEGHDRRTVTFATRVLGRSASRRSS